MARHITRDVVLVALVLASVPTAALAQQEAVRVTAREAEIRTRPDARSPMIGRAVTGTVLQVVATERNWYLVVIPPHVRLVPTAPDQGYVEARLVTLLPPGDPRAAVKPPATGATQAGKPATEKGAAAGPGLRWRAFGTFAYERFQASRSFEATYDSASAPSFGGGLELLAGRHLFVQGEYAYLQRTGERVFVFEDEVFPLGVGQKLKLSTIAINGGYRFGRPASAVTPYLGAGAVIAFYNERATGTTAGGDDFSESGAGGQALGGVEFRISRWVGAAVEGRYRFIPGILGDDGVSKEFAEDNLGGGAVAVKLVFGR